MSVDAFDVKIKDAIGQLWQRRRSSISARSGRPSCAASSPVSADTGRVLGAAEPVHQHGAGACTGDGLRDVLPPRCRVVRRRGEHRRARAGHAPDGAFDPAGRCGDSGSGRADGPAEHAGQRAGLAGHGSASATSAVRSARRSRGRYINSGTCRLHVREGVDIDDNTVASTFPHEPAAVG